VATPDAWSSWNSIIRRPVTALQPIKPSARLAGHHHLVLAAVADLLAPGCARVDVPSAAPEQVQMLRMFHPPRRSPDRKNRLICSSFACLNYDVAAHIG
jgi:hypothetical protein